MFGACMGFRSNRLFIIIMPYPHSILILMVTIGLPSLGIYVIDDIYTTVIHTISSSVNWIYHNKTILVAI